eukprot:9201080-Lingulodinium_polyedra.AAC.1
MGEELPACHNAAWLWFLPKGDSPTDAADSCMRKAGDTRPLSGSDCAAKLFPSALVYCANSSGATDQWVTTMQNGFVPGRAMLQNVLDGEAAAYAASLTETNPCALLFDYKAAFPSVSRDWIHIIIKEINFPEYVRKAIEALYAKCTHIYARGGKIYFAALSGVKQGCPASAFIFAV